MANYVDLTLVDIGNGKPVICIAPGWKISDNDDVVIDFEGNEVTGKVVAHCTTEPFDDEYKFILKISPNGPYKIIKKVKYIALETVED